MTTRRPRAAILAVAAALAVTTGGLTTGPAAAATPASSLTVFLKPPNAAALAKLAARHGLTRAQRVAAVTKLLPTATERATAIRQLRGEGLTVTGSTAWSVTATAPQSTVTEQFGSRPALPSHPSARQRRVATGALPRLPAGLRAVATAAYPTASGPAVFHHAATLDGADFRDAYTSAARTAAGVSPYSGRDTAGSLTIATIQLTGWNSSDLTTYATKTGDTSFSAASDLTQVPVDQGSVPGVSTSNDDDIEVDLDQESILSTDPYAHQRPYFAPNSAAGYADAFSQVLDDVLQDPDAYRGGDPSIAALSVSWGACEGDTGTSEMTQTLEPIMQSLVAAGVTIFGSSGDDGVYDCANGTTGVDYPASSPEVVGVGASALSAVGTAAPNRGSNWTETAWSCTSETSCKNNGGTGGGASSVFGAPSYQAAITDPPFAGAPRRLVPDISADGNPDTGFVIYTTDPTDSRKYGHKIAVGGSSLSTPVSAALLTNALAAHGATSGVGDIHQDLYAAYSLDAGGFRDITLGTNGAAGANALDPSVSAQVGYDTVSGLGAPLWPLIAAQIYGDSGNTPEAKDVAPSLSAQLALAHPDSAKHPRTVTARWSATKAAAGDAVESVKVVVTRAGHASAVYQTTAAQAAGTHTFTGKPGATYVLRAIATDTAGTPSTAKVAEVTVPIDDRDFSTHGRWRRHASRSAVGGSFATTSAHRAYSRVSATGRIYLLAVQVGPGKGKLQVSVGSRRRETINLYRARSGRKTIRIYGSAKAAINRRTFTFSYLGRKTAAASGTSVDVDALYPVRS